METEVSRKRRRRAGIVELCCVSFIFFLYFFIESLFFMSCFRDWKMISFSIWFWILCDGFSCVSDDYVDSFGW